MVTVGSIAWNITANTNNFTAGVKATKGELRAMKDAFLASQPPIDRYNAAINRLGQLAHKFPDQAEPLLNTIKDIRLEMMALAGMPPPSFLSDVKARSGQLEFSENLRVGSGRDLPSFDRQPAGLLQITTAARAVDSLGQSSGRSAGQLKGLAGLITTMTGGFGNLSGVMKTFGSAGGVVGLAGLGIGGLALKLAHLADATRDARNEAAGLRTSKDIAADRDKQLGIMGEDSGLTAASLNQAVASFFEFANAASGAESRSHLKDVIASEIMQQNEFLKLLKERQAQEQEMSDIAGERLRMFEQQDAAAELEQLNGIIEMERDLRATSFFMEKERVEQLAENGRKAQEMMDQVNQEIAAKGEQLAESLKTPAEKLGDDLKELTDARGLGSITDATFQRGLEDLQAKAEGMAGLGDTGTQSVAAMRAGTVEALRASTGGANQEKQLAEQKRTAENTELANDLQREIRDLLKGNQIVEAL